MRLLKISIFLLFALFLAISTPALSLMSSDRTPADVAFERAMTSMQTAMERVHLTGNPDADFAALMISHHQGAIEMAKVELLHGTNPRLRRLAQEIIVTQRSEIAVIQLALKHLNQNHE